MVGVSLGLSLLSCGIGFWFVSVCLLPRVSVRECWEAGELCPEVPDGVGEAFCLCTGGLEVSLCIGVGPRGEFPVLGLPVCRAYIAAVGACWSAWRSARGCRGGSAVFVSSRAGSGVFCRAAWCGTKMASAGAGPSWSGLK
ncbi:hypothetical protein GDO86_006132 [Hymenochirus boettgeri]|uniref:Uncharacterized protein n=1 Tax=Hymenochirus boettgeri TaxID=247094 RepID=A0A8T2J935_9PIPI|nr:hypothetical protein GDO86_006132 [Hymenochirus boettgeri]